jgi:kynureninase
LNDEFGRHIVVNTQAADANAASALILAGEATQRSTAERLDELDPLRRFREQFVIADDTVCYLDGNSLGRLPVATRGAVNSFLDTEWATEVVDGWSHWIDEAQVVGDILAAAALGTGPGQTLVCDTTSVNLYQLLGAAITARPGRHTIVVDSANFPTDRYVVHGLAKAHGLTIVTLDNDGSGGPGAQRIDTVNELITAEALEPFLTEDVAVLTLQAVNYRSGARPDMAAITALARSKGILVVWDCAHAVGSIDLDFDGNGVDLAVGCTYKYGNSGPGAPAWLFVRRDLQGELRPPIQGWFAQADQFAMGPEFEPTDTIRGFQIASPNIIGLRAVATGFEMIQAAGIEAIEAKAALGTELMIRLFDAWLEPLGFRLGTPRAAARRGGHITIHHPDAQQIALAMRSSIKVVPDFRMPDGIRLACSPLPTSFTEIWDGFARTRELVASGNYRTVYAEGNRVT